MSMNQKMCRVKEIPTNLQCLPEFLSISLYQLWLTRVGSFNRGNNLNISPLTFSLWYSKVGLSCVSLLCHQSKHTVKTHGAISHGKTR